jgi:hypothetical protein
MRSHVDLTAMTSRCDWCSYLRDFLCEVRAEAEETFYRMKTHAALFEVRGESQKTVERSSM